MSRDRWRALPLGGLLIVLAGASAPAAAQGVDDPREEDLAPATASAPAGAASQPRDARRLFQRFAEDSAIVPAGWAEAQAVYTNLPGSAARVFVGSLLAFRLSDRAEAGMRLGWTKVDSDDTPDGSGLADIDLYGKYRFHGSAGRCAVGGLVKVPAADEEKGLGTGSADAEVFGACRAELKAATVAVNAGVRYNGGTDDPLPDSEASVLLGGALLLPTGARSTIVIEPTWESERLSGAGSDARLTLGFQYSPPAAGFGMRGAFVLPLSDGAPDSEIIFGAVWLY